jgi:pSer/pThr/pTyr-binding forkhead associated (FHA) protein
MHDGRTRKVEAETTLGTIEFLETHVASLTVLSGPAAGLEFPLDSPRVIAGRSDRARIRLAFDSISSEHAAFELGEKGFGVRDLASTNGVLVNGKEVLSQPLEHGDRVLLGDCELQYVVEARDRTPMAWGLDETG